MECITFPEIMSQTTMEEVFHEVMIKLQQITRQRTCVIIIPRIDVWLEHVSSLLENILFSTLCSLSLERSILLLCTSHVLWNLENCWKYEWPKDIFEYFNSFDNHFSLS